jgi:hypothetical protein
MRNFNQKEGRGAIIDRGKFAGAELKMPKKCFPGPPPKQKKRIFFRNEERFLGYEINGFRY